MTINAKSALLPLVFLALVGCGGGNSSSDNSSQEPASAGPIGTMSNDVLDAINTPDARAALERLDRSENLVGPDTNDNKIRDDVENYISVLPLTDNKKKYALQMARALQNSLLIDLSDRVALQRDFDDLRSAVGCLFDAFEPNGRDSFRLKNRIKAITFNTKARTRRFIESNQAASGLAHGPRYQQICD